MFLILYYRKREPVFSLGFFNRLLFDKICNFFFLISNNYKENWTNKCRQNKNNWKSWMNGIWPLNRLTNEQMNKLNKRNPFSNNYTNTYIPNSIIGWLWCEVRTISICCWPIAFTFLVLVFTRIPIGLQ